MSIGEGVLEQWKAFRRLTVDAAAMVLKLDSDEQTIVLDNEGIEEISPEELAEKLSEYQPRWIIWSIKVERDDGRVQYPLIPLYFSPESCPERARMLYSSNTVAVSQILKFAKVHSISDLDDMTMNALKQFHLATVTT